MINSLEPQSQQTIELKNMLKIIQLSYDIWDL